MRDLCGLGWPRRVDKSEGLGGPGRAQALSIKVRAWGAGLAQGQTIEVKGFQGYGPGASGPTLFGKPSLDGVPNRLSPTAASGLGGARTFLTSQPHVTIPQPKWSKTK